MIRPGGFQLIPPVIKNLIIINVIMYLGTSLFNSGINYPGGLVNLLSLHYPTSPYFQPFQLVTYMFMHGGLWHILFNMLALWMFGSEIENIWGPKRFLIYYLVCGFGAVALHFVMAYFRMADMSVQEAMFVRDTPMLGASGAVFGILLAFGMMFPNRRIMLLFPPIPMKAKYFVIGYGLLELYSGIGNRAGDNIAHFAHLGGMLVGIVLILVWKKQGKLY